jgi:nucleoside-diphosphate-sugar epimerase
VRIAVTGASGFIGRELVSCAHEHGYAVAQVSRSLTPGLDYEDAQALAHAFTGADVVVHLAARAHVRGDDADFGCNVRSARAVAQAAQAAGVRRIALLSSIGVNGNVTHARPFTEADAPAPVEAYARSKLRAELEVRAGTVEWVIVRPPLVYGANAPGNFARLVHAVARGWPLPLAAVQNLRSLVGVRNLCELILACATQADAARQLFLAADGDDLSTPDILRCVAHGLGKPARLWSPPVPLLKAGAALAGATRIAESLCASLQVDASQARRILGWVPATDSHEGIRRAAADWRFA